MNSVIVVWSLVLFWLLGVHHYLKHKELSGLNRFIQYKDLAKAIWHIIKSHEGLMLLALIIAIIGAI